MPVRIVTDGGDPVRIVTHGGDPVRIVTDGISDPVRVIGGGLAPDAPTFVSGEVGTVDASTVVVTFSTDISAPCGDCALGFTVLVNGAPNAITACVIVGGNTVRLTLTNPVVFGDVITVSYDSTVGCIMESTGVTDLATFAAQAVTNNVAAVGWWLSGGIAAANCIAAYTPKGAANLAASYDNNAAPGNGLPDGTYDAAPGVAPTWDAVNGWKFDNATNKYLTTGISVTNNQTWSAIIRFSNVTDTNKILFGAAAVGAFQIAPNYTAKIIYSSGGSLQISATLTVGNLAIAGTTAYRNGVAEAGAIPATAGVIPALYIGARQLAGTFDLCITAYIQALAIYSVTITAPQVTALVAAMAAL